MAGKLTDYVVTGLLSARALGRRLRFETDPTPLPDDFIDRMQMLISEAEPGLIAESKWLNMPAAQAPWVGSGMDLPTASEVSYFADGRIYANTFLDIWVNPNLQIWSKIGENGEIFRGTRNSLSFCTPNNNELYFLIILKKNSHKQVFLNYKQIRKFQLKLHNKFHSH